VSEGGGWYQFVIPERTLAGPLRVDTAGGNFEVGTVPIDSQKSVGFTAIVASSITGTPTNAALPSANTGQVITLQGFGFTTTSNIIFQAVTHDGTRGVIGVRPTRVPKTPGRRDRGAADKRAESDADDGDGAGHCRDWTGNGGRFDYQHQSSDSPDAG